MLLYISERQSHPFVDISHAGLICMLSFPVSNAFACSALVRGYSSTETTGLFAGRWSLLAGKVPLTAAAR